MNNSLSFVRRSFARYVGVVSTNVLIFALPLSATETGNTHAFVRQNQGPKELTSEDWTGIRGAYETKRHAMFAVQGGYQARNPEQQWLTKFDGRGFINEPTSGDWQWGLELRGYGFVGHTQIIEASPKVEAEEQRIAYRWDAALEEWFVNDQRGLEHGFTIGTRPAGGDSAAELEIDLAVRGNLQPKIASNGLSVCFVRNEERIVTYSELKVIDANSKKLAARFVSTEDGLGIRVDVQGAKYPITVDPIAQQVYLKASNTEPFDNFGYSVAISGDTVVVGAPAEDSNASGVNGDQTNNSASNAGAAYVFVRNGTTWSQQAYLKASNTDADDRFSYSGVAVSGDTVVVGAFGEASNATGVNGNQNDNSATQAGAAYVFVRNGTTWSQQAYLKASNTDANDFFGFSMAVSGDTVVVGAYGEDSDATGVNGDQNDNSAPFSGAAYVFVRSGVTWSQQAYLKASNTDADDSFGFSVAISGDTVIVGAQTEYSNATGVNGDQTNNSAGGAGAAYVFMRTGTTWGQQAYLKASNTAASDEFGSSVAISGDTVVIGATFEDSNATAINGDQTNNSASSAGAAYVFARNGSTWSQQAYLKASNTNASDQFGSSVAVSGDTVVVGANGEDSNATGINGDQTNNSASFAGAAYVFMIEPSIVTNTSDSGAGSLRQALADALNGETITFNIPTADPGFNAGVWTITLTSGELVIEKDVTISGLGADVLVVNRDGNAPAFRIFDLLPGKTVALEGLTISNGKATVGGGIINNHSNLTINNCTLTGNTAPGGNGGGIFNYGTGNPASLTINNSTFSGNSSDFGGGGVYNAGNGGSGKVFVNNSTFSGNSTVNVGGGGIYTDGSGGGDATVTVVNSTFSGNSGSGIALFTSQGGVANLDITNSTFAGNTAQFGGALHIKRADSGAASIRIGNTVFEQGTLGENVYNDSTAVTSLGFNLVSDNGINNVNTGTGSFNAAGDRINTDPMLGPLKNNGGPTLTHMPLVNGPAIDQGKRDTIPDLTNDFDQRGFARPVDDPAVANAASGDASDIGAVEVGSFVHPTSAASWKTHGGAGSFPIDLPFTGPVGIECRSGGASNAYQVIINFANPVTYTSATLSDGTGIVATNSGSGTNQITLNLTGVTNAQIITLALFDANNGANSGDVGIRMGVLVGDANGSGGVNATDVSQVKSQSGQATGAGNFRSDVIASGVINATDVSAVKLKSGTGLP